MMRMEHMAMYVNDLERTKDFFLTYFEAKCNDGYQNVKTGFHSYFLSFEGGARLEIMSKADVVNAEKPLTRTGFAHVAFSTGSREKVDVLTERLKKDGYEVISGPRVTGDGYYESCILDEEGNQIEITV